MRKRLARLLPILWLMLLGAQQATFAHWAEHLAAPASAGTESRHGESGAAAADRFCANCAAYAALGGPIPDWRPHPAPADVPAPRIDPCAGQKSVSPIRRFDARAPPVLA